jgi:hypothetical protein
MDQKKKKKKKISKKKKKNATGSDGAWCFLSKEFFREWRKMADFISVQLQRQRTAKPTIRGTTKYTLGECHCVFVHVRQFRILVHYWLRKVHHGAAPLDEIVGLWNTFLHSAS